MSYSKIYNYDDFLAFLSDSGYAESAKKQKDALDESLALQISDLENQKENINQSSDELARQAYISYLVSSKDLPEKISATGLNGGAADNLYLSLANEYQNNYNEIGKERQNKLNETDNAISKAKLSNSASFAESLSKLYNSAVDDFLGVRESEEERNFDSFYKEKEYADREADRKAENERAESDREIELAKLAWETGDFSFLEKLGIVPSVGDDDDSDGSSSGITSSLQHITELAKQMDYAVTLAKYGNYDLFCEITGMTEEQAALQFADKSEGYSESEIRDAAKLFMSGDYSNNILGVLKKAYPDYSYQQIWKLWESVALTEWYMNVSAGYQGPKG